MSGYFPKPKSLGVNVKVELDLTKKAYLKNAEVFIHQILLKRLIELI